MNNDKDYTASLWLIIGLLFLILMSTGCAITPEERQRRDDRSIIDQENWRMCELVYTKAGAPTWHIDHMHTRSLRGPALRMALRSDLRINSCRQILRDYWADYV